MSACPELSRDACMLPCSERLSSHGQVISHSHQRCCCEIAASLHFQNASLRYGRSGRMECTRLLSSLNASLGLTRLTALVDMETHVSIHHHSAQFVCNAEGQGRDQHSKTLMQCQGLPLTRRSRKHGRERQEI